MTATRSGREPRSRSSQNDLHHQSSFPASGWPVLFGVPTMSDMVSTSFKLPEWLDKLLPTLAELDGHDGKSEYLRSLILADLAGKRKQAALFMRLADAMGDTQADVERQGGVE